MNFKSNDSRPHNLAALSAQRDADFLTALQPLVDEGDDAAALALCREQQRLFPDDAAAYRHIALLCATDSEPAAAIRAARRACELAPDDARNWSGLGRVHALLGELENAVTCFAEAVAIDTHYADGWHNLGTALRRLGQHGSAFAALKNALLIDPKRADTYLSLGNLLVETRQLEDALECFERAAQCDPNMPRARSKLGFQLSRRGKVKRAETLFRQSLGMDPDHIDGWMGLGHALEDLGEEEAARGAYLNVLQRRPDHAVALGRYLALLRDESAQGKDVGSIGSAADATRWLAKAEAVLRDSHVADEARALVGYGLAKYHDRHGNYAAAADAGLLANAARRHAAGTLDRAALTERIDRIIETYTADFFRSRRRWGVGAGQPVFIVGLPRSGTTLTEQIIAAHPQLHGAGELPDLGRLAASLLGDDDSMWQAALRLQETHSRVLAADYLQALRDGAPKGRLRISDKSPLNFFQLALAALLFPNARVVHCVRNARDNALSIWMENFNPDQRYATSFDDLAFFHREYARLMAHWRDVLPLTMLEFRYEDTVAAVEEQARRLIGFLGADWDERCLNFHQNGRAVQTPSRWQVRQPIYSRSVERWRHYESYLPDLGACEF
jgi:tetratricopeptide (TPR) repeat protein